MMLFLKDITAAANKRSIKLDQHVAFIRDNEKAPLTFHAP
jgi:hypothetical protein